MELRRLAYNTKLNIILVLLSCIPAMLIGTIAYQQSRIADKPAINKIIGCPIPCHNAAKNTAYNANFGSARLTLTD